MQAEKNRSDEVLIRRVLEGHQEDFAPLVERHASPLLHFVGRMIPVRDKQIIIAYLADIKLFRLKNIF